MDKRTLLAIVLSLGILILWQFFFAPPPPTTPTPAPAKAVKEKPTGTDQPSPAVPADARSVSPAAAVPSPQTQPSAPREIIVDTELYRATINTAGATLSAFELKAYKEDGGAGVRLVHPKAGTLPPLAILLDTGHPDAPATAVYAADRDKITLSGQTSDRLTLSYQDPSGLLVSKAFTFRGNDYAIDLSIRVQGASSWSLSVGSGFGLASAAPTDTGVHVGPSLLTGTDRKSLVLSDLKKGDLSFTDVKWIAREDMYFTAALKPASGSAAARVWNRENVAEIAVTLDQPTAEFVLFAGPKQYDILKRIGLQDIVDFGFWSFIAHPLFWFLKVLYKMTGNYGVAIILISVLTRVPFIPLMTKSQASMKAMQNLNPKMQELRTKYKNDPQRLQAETMKLYKEAGVNPMSGCLPMLLQIPVFFALYKVLLAAIELRQAPFMLWIQDLSKPDTLFGHLPQSIPLLGGAALGILPILMGVTMWIQQKMTPNPATMDPNQAKVMKYLPVIFTFMFFNLSSGLVLYWTVGNVVGIFQQMYSNRKNAEQAAA